MFGLIWAVIIGFIVGLIAKFIMPGKDPGGFIVTTLLGIGGALVATWIGRSLGWYARQPERGHHRGDHRRDHHSGDLPLDPGSGRGRADGSSRGACAPLRRCHLRSPSSLRDRDVHAPGAADHPGGTMSKFGLAQPVRRVEDPRLLKGEGRYTDDITVPGMLHGVVLRSPHAAARSCRSTPRRRRPCRASSRSTPARTQGRWHRLGALHRADEEPGRNGPRQPAALRAGRGRGPACRRSSRIHRGGDVPAGGTPPSLIDGVTTSCLRSRISPSATQDGAPLVWPDVPNNVAFDWEIGDKAATDSLFAKAAHVTRLTIVNNRIVVNSMEARAALAEYDTATGRWTLYSDTQGCWLLKDLLGPRVFKCRAGQLPDHHPRCRRRLRHEAVPLSRARRWPATRPQKLGVR